MNKLSFVVAFLSLVAMSIASAGSLSEREHDLWFDRMGDEEAYIFDDDILPGEKSSFAAMESVKPASSEYIELVDGDPAEEGDVL
jgi:hypothetical protein